MIDYYCKTLLQELAKSVQDSLDLLAVVQSGAVVLETAMKLAIQKNTPRSESYSSKKTYSKYGKKDHVARFCNSYSILEAAVKSAKQI